jgi:uncharacterized LabA/DUF88 family protein
MSNSSNLMGCALFIDIENVIGGCSTLGIKVDLKPVCDKLMEVSTLRLRKAYGDIAKSCFSIGLDSSEINSIRKNLSTNLIEINDVPYVTNHKNAADMYIVTSALSLAYENSNIDSFAILSTDKDFVPLYTKLKELGKKVIIISIDKVQTSQILTSIADNLFYYEFLPGINLPIKQNEQVPEQGNYMRLLERACQTITEAGEQVLGSNLLSKMRQLQSDFDYKQMGFKKFIDFLKHVEKNHNFLSIRNAPESGGDISITLVSDYKQEVQQHVDSNHLEEKYKVFLEEKLKCTLFKIDKLDSICNTIEEVFTIEYDNNKLLKGMSLQTLSEKSLEAINLSDPNFGISSGSMYKILLSLHFSRAFYVSPSEDNQFNPFILSFINYPPNLLKFLINNWLLLIIQSKMFYIDPVAFSRLFYGDAKAEHVAKIKEYLDDVVDRFNLSLN